MCCFSVCPYCRRTEHAEHFTECDCDGGRDYDHITEYPGTEYVTPPIPDRKEDDGRAAD